MEGGERGQAVALRPGQAKAAQPGRVDEVDDIRREFAQGAEGGRRRRAERQLRVRREGQAGHADDLRLAIAFCPGAQLRRHDGGGQAALLQMIQQQAEDGNDAIAFWREGIGEKGDARRLWHNGEGSVNGALARRAPVLY